jgi:hypothetical protein
MIIYAFKEWHPPLKISSHTIQVISDHWNSMGFTTIHLLNYYQTC